MKLIAFAALSVCVLMVAPSSAQDTSGLDGLVTLLAEVDDADFQLDLLKGIRDGLQGRKSVPMPKGWKEVYPKLAKSPKPQVREQAKLLALTFGDPAALAELRKTMLDADAPVDRRQAALEALVARRTEDLAPQLHGLLDDQALRAAALRGLAAYQDEQTPPQIVARYKQLTEEEKHDAIATLTARPAYAMALLDAVEKGAIPRTDISAFTARQISSFPDQKLRARLIEVWGNLQEVTADKRALIAKYKQLLTPEAVATADAREGRAIYRRTCHQCHRLFGEGGQIGPDLTGANRANIDYVLENVLTPSAAIAKDYQLKTIITLDGRLVSGIIKQTSDNALTVQTANEQVVVPREDIDEINTSPVSMMPDGLWAKLSEAEVCDLVKYLASREQVPLPPGFREPAEEARIQVESP